MYITLSNILNGGCTPLNPIIDNRRGDYEIALREILYYPAWVNISAGLGNNMFHYGGKAIYVPDGYYDICSLSEQAFEPLKLKLTLNPANGRVSVLDIKRPFDLGALGPTLGFETLIPDIVEGIATAESFHKLLIYRELFVHLQGLSSSENRLNRLPSDLLRAIPVKREACNSGRAEAFTTPHFKRLENGTLSSLEISIRDEHRRLVNLDYLSCVLEVRQRGE